MGYDKPGQPAQALRLGEDAITDSDHLALFVAQSSETSLQVGELRRVSAAMRDLVISPVTGAEAIFRPCGIRLRWSEPVLTGGLLG